MSVVGQNDNDVLRISFQQEDESEAEVSAGDILDDAKYHKKSADLIREVLSDNGSILQLEDGSVLVTKTTVVTVLYKWDREKSKFVRAKAGGMTERAQSGYAANSRRENKAQHQRNRREELVEA